MADFTYGPFLTVGYCLGMVLMMIAFTLVMPAVLMITNSVYRILLALELLPQVLSLAMQGSELAARFLGTMVGSILISFSYMLRYFDRVVEHSNHAATHDELTGLLNRRAICIAPKKDPADAQCEHASGVALYTEAAIGTARAAG